MRFREFKPIILEGGNIFKDATGMPVTQRINKSDIEPTIQWLESITQLPLVDNTLGSVGKKESSGDLDIAVDQNAISKDELASRLTNWVKSKDKDPKDWVKKSGISVHFLTPIKGDPAMGYVQTDFMFGPDIEQMKFGLFSAGDASKFSGAERNLIMSSIAKSTGMKYSWQKGLMNRESETVITTNPDSVAQYLLGQGAGVADLESVETIMAALARTPKRVEFLRTLVPKLRDTKDKKPGVIKSDNEEADRIEKALGVYNESLAHTGNNLTESRGLFGRKLGDVFVDKSGEKIAFEQIYAMPNDKAGSAYPDETSMLKAFEKLTQGYDVKPVNTRTARHKAFAVADFRYEDGSYETWVKWYEKMPLNLLGSWPNKEVPPGTTWSLNTKGATKMVSGLSPQDLIKSEAVFGSVNQIVAQINQNAPNPEISQGVTEFAKGKIPAVFPNQKENMEAIRDYLGEVLQPIGLMNGTIKGQAEVAAKDILKASYNQCKVYWPQSKTTGLVDSYFIAPNGERLGISSKGGAGAAASIKNIMDAIAKARAKNSPLIKEYADQIKIIEIIDQNSAKVGPIMLAVRLKIIDSTTAEEIINLVDQRIKTTKGLSPEAKALLADYKADTANPSYSVGFHLLSSLTNKVMEKVSGNKRFGQACLAFMNQSSIVQVYTKASVVGEDVKITGFDTIYPPNYTGTFKLTGKGYSASNIKGKITFKFDPKGQPGDVELLDTEPVTAVAEPIEKKPAKPLSSLKKASKDAKEIIDKNKATVGRGKR